MEGQMPVPGVPHPLLQADKPRPKSPVPIGKRGEQRGGLDTKYEQFYQCRRSSLCLRP